MQPSGSRGHGVLESAREATALHEMAVGHFGPRGVGDWAKDLGAALVSRWLVTSDSTHLIVELCGESLGSRRRGASVDEHELQSFVSTGSGESASIYSTALASDVEAGTTRTQSGRPVASTQTMRLAPLVRP